jgi:MOSC domain-containing protein YiiM
MIERLFISPGHNYFGHHGKPADQHALIEVAEIECVAGRGIRGDRSFDYKDNYQGQITFFAWEVYVDLCRQFSVKEESPGVFRRNAVTRGLNLNALIGQEFELQGVAFAGTAECKPCYWMNQAFASGAEAAMQGRGGLRARILTSGWLSAGLESAGENLAISVERQRAMIEVDGKPLHPDVTRGRTYRDWS